MRSLRFGLLAVAVALAAPSPAPAQPTQDPDLSVSSKPSLPTAPLELAITARADVRVPDIPVPNGRPSFPFEYVAIGLAAAKKTRRSAGAKSKVPMYLDSHVTVMRENKNGDPETVRVEGGVLVDDTDLTDEEIDELTARRVVRPATAEEIDRLEKQEANAERDQLVKDQEAEVAELRASHEQARAKLGAEASPSKVSALEEKQSKELAALQTSHAKALAKFDEE